MAVSRSGGRTEPSLTQLRAAVLPRSTRGLHYERLIELALAEALQDPGNVGQEVGSASGQLTELGHRGGVLSLGQLSPPGVMPCGAVQLGNQDPVSLRTIIEHAF